MNLTLALKYFIHHYGKRFLLFVGTVFLLTGKALAQEPDVKTKSGANAQQLAKELSNPVASLISVPFQNNTDYGIGPDRGSKNTLNFQPVIPIKLTKDWNLIFRAILPLVTQNSITADGAKQNGLSDATVSAFFSPSHSKIIWAFGPAFLVPTATNSYLGTEKFGIGPTGLVLDQAGAWTFGMLANQIWSVAGNADRPPVNQLFLQPFLVYNWPSGAGVSANAEITQNWQIGNCNSTINLLASGVTKLGKQVVQFGVGPRIPVSAAPGLKPDWGWRTVLTFVFPK